MKKWKVLETRTIFRNQWFDLKEEKVQITEDLAIEGVLVHHFSDWVNVIPITASGEVILENQYRHGMGVTTIETPSGSVEEEDASLEEAAERELYEETGYATGEIVFLGKSQANPQLMNNWVHHFLALDCHVVARPQPEIGFEIDFWLLPFEKAMEQVRSGKIQHATTVEGLLRSADWLNMHGGKVGFPWKK